jgi:predicted ATP-grasp superfamily ATP-dependent carboligase
MTALLLDAHLKSSLAAIRSLGRRGIPVIAGSFRRTAMGLHSRYVRESFLYPSPLENRRGFIEAINRCSGRFGKTVLLVFSDATLLPLARDENLLAGQAAYVLPPSRDCFEIAFDKASTLKLAQKIGVEIPVTYFCASESDVAHILPELTYPVVIKPRRSVSWRGDTGTHRTTSFVFSAEQLKTKCASVLSKSGEFPLIQKYILGEEAGVEYLCDKGTVLAACAHRRIRSLSPEGGPSVVKQTVPLSYQGLGERAERLVAALRWSGPIMVEFKIDRASGVPMLMETNGRFWGSLPLAIAAGVDFPYLLYRLARGEHVTPNLQYQEGVVTRHLMADFKNLLWVLFKNDPLRPIAYPTRMRAIRDFIFAPKGCKPDVRDLRDMRPALAEIIDTVTRVTARKAREFWAARVRR